MDFTELEVSEGLRWTWDAWPTSGKCSSSSSSRWLKASAPDDECIPLAIMCCPIASSSVLDDTGAGIPVLKYAPLRCRACRGVLNPYARVDVPSYTWACPFCFYRNPFPTSYHGAVSESSLPAELFPSHTRLDYVLPPPAPSSAYAVTYSSPMAVKMPTISGPAFVFVLDTCLAAEDLHALKSAVSQAALALLSENAMVALISFGAQVWVHELACANYSNKAIVLSGNRELSPERVQELLGISHKRTQRTFGANKSGVQRFVVPISECDFNFTAIIEDLQPDSLCTSPSHRPQRATGVALSVAVGLMVGCKAHKGTRIMLFVGGPATLGPGMIVDTNYEKSMRTHSDLLHHRAPHYTAAHNFYKRLNDRFQDNGFILDIFACSLDQVGVYEARSVVENSGGIIVLAETFNSDEFKKSLQQLFVRDSEGLLKMYFNATIEVVSTQKVKVKGVLGPCSLVVKRTTDVSDNKLGMGTMSMWKMCSLTDKTHLAFLFEVTDIPPSAQPGSPFIIQFVTTYQRSDGELRVRVVTASRRWIDGSRIQDLAAGFDQEMAAAIVTRLAVHRVSQGEVISEVLTWLDRLLIRFASTYGDYNKEDAESFRLSSNLSLFPQLVFHLRRSQFVQVINNTPDETAFFRLMLNREGVVGTVIMIQPTLLSYSFSGPSMPVLLDVTSIKPDCILLFDAFFWIVVHYGSTIAHWRKLGYHKDPLYETFKRLLEAPVMDAQSLLLERNPLPKFIECDQHSGQARFLLAKLNPSVTHKSQHIGDSDVIFTDDVSLQDFISHLQELAVKENYL